MPLNPAVGALKGWHCEVVASGACLTGERWPARQHHPLVEQSVGPIINTATPQGIAAASRGMARRADASDLLSSISCPTLVIVGEQDVFTPPTVAREYAASISGSQLATIPHAGHLSNLEQPEAFLGVVRNFLVDAF